MINSEKDNSGLISRLEELMADERPYSWAKRIGLSPATFDRMWKKGISPKADVLLLISEKTGCSIDWLLKGKVETEAGRGSAPGYLVCEERADCPVTGMVKSKDPVMAEIVDILENDLPEDKPFILKILRGKQQVKEGLQGMNPRF